MKDLFAVASSSVRGTSDWFDSFPGRLVLAKCVKSMTFLNPWPSFIETVTAEAVFNIALTLLAQAYTELDINYMNVTGSILSSYRFLAERSISPHP